MTDFTLYTADNAPQESKPLLGKSVEAFGMVPGRPNFSHMVAAYSIEAFTDVAQFKFLMDDFLRALRTTPPAPGADRVLYPGLPEHEAELDRRARGIPLHKEVIEWFKDTCSEMDIPYDLS